MIKCPCTKDCPDRIVECRKTCSAWKEYEAQKRADYAQREKSLQHLDDLISIERRRAKKRMKGIR